MLTFSQLESSFTWGRQAGIANGSACGLTDETETEICRSVGETDRPLVGVPLSLSPSVLCVLAIHLPVHCSCACQFLSVACQKICLAVKMCSENAGKTKPKTENSRKRKNYKHDFHVHTKWLTDERKLYCNMHTAGEEGECRTGGREGTHIAMGALHN